jgi:hypothetical protein
VEELSALDIWAEAAAAEGDAGTAEGTNEEEEEEEEEEDDEEDADEADGCARDEGEEANTGMDRAVGAGAVSCRRESRNRLGFWATSRRCTVLDKIAVVGGVSVRIRAADRAEAGKVRRMPTGERIGEAA